MWSWLFGVPPTPKEMLIDCKKTIRTGIRELERDRERLQRDERKLQREVKEIAAQGNMGAARMMAKQIIRIRNDITRRLQEKMQLEGVLSTLQTMSSTAAMAESMKTATRAIYTLNQRMNLPQLQRFMQTYEKESAIQQMKLEIMNDTLDDALHVDGEEDDENILVDQVLDEIGIDMTSSFKGTPVDKDVQERLNKLKGAQ